MGAPLLVGSPKKLRLIGCDDNSVSLASDCLSRLRPTLGQWWAKSARLFLEMMFLEKTLPRGNVPPLCLASFRGAGTHLLAMRRVLAGDGWWKPLVSCEKPPLLGARPLPSDSINWAPFDCAYGFLLCSWLYSGVSFQFCWAVSPSPGHVSLSLSPPVQSLLGGRGGGGS